jgi:hypothetical protein
MISEARRFSKPPGFRILSPEFFPSFSDVFGIFCRIPLDTLTHFRYIAVSPPAEIATIQFDFLSATP